MNLVLIETTGNQSYLFATNKLRENVGASELTSKVGTQFVLESVRDVRGQDLWHDTMAEVWESLREERRNPWFEKDKYPVEVIIAASGKALLPVKEPNQGEEIIRVATLQALREAPGLEVRGVVIREFDFETTPLHPLIGEVHRQFEAPRASGSVPAIADPSASAASAWKSTRQARICTMAPAGSRPTPGWRMPCRPRRIKTHSSRNSGMLCEPRTARPYLSRMCRSSPRG